MHHIFEQHQSGYQNADIHAKNQADRHSEFEHAKPYQHLACRNDHAKYNRDDCANQEDNIIWPLHQGIQVTDNGDHCDTVQDWVYIIQQTQWHGKLAESLFHYAFHDPPYWSQAHFLLVARIILIEIFRAQ